MAAPNPDNLSILIQTIAAHFIIQNNIACTYILIWQKMGRKVGVPLAWAAERDGLE